MTPVRRRRPARRVAFYALARARSAEGGGRLLGSISAPLPQPLHPYDRFPSHLVKQAAEAGCMLQEVWL
jgi:hypothetical protein